MRPARNVNTCLVAMSVLLLALFFSGRADAQGAPKTTECPPGQVSVLVSGGGGMCLNELPHNPGPLSGTLDQSICYSDADCKLHFKCTYTGYDPDQKDNYGICVCGQDCNPPPNRRGNSGS